LVFLIPFKEVLFTVIETPDVLSACNIKAISKEEVKILLKYTYA
jgi:hypothetical protein